jgi:hypothetical protein
MTALGRLSPAEIEAAAAEFDDHDAHDYAVDGIAWVTQFTDLRYAPLDVDQARCVVACDGEVIGVMWPQTPGQHLHGWMGTARVPGTTVAELLAVPRSAANLGPERTGLHMAAMIADAADELLPLQARTAEAVAVAVAAPKPGTESHAS